jgi:hypothetical protein
MGISFVLDEQLRGQLWVYVEQHNLAGVHPIDVTRVGDPLDLPLGTADPDILIWAERTGRIVVSADVTTMPGHFRHHLSSGRHSPGLFLLRARASAVDIADFLAVTTYASDPDDWVDAWCYIP